MQITVADDTAAELKKMLTATMAGMEKSLAQLKKQVAETEAAMSHIATTIKAMDDSVASG